MPPRYANLDPAHTPAPFDMVFRWAIWDRLTRRRRVAPPGPPAPAYDGPREPWQANAAADRLLWAGHSTYLARLAGHNLLFDPVLTPRIGGVYPRYGKAGLRFDELPPLAAVALSHNHYDHMDEPTLLRLPRETPMLVPAGLGDWFRRRRFVTVHELGWWQSVELGGLTVTFVPARHWSRRTPWDVNQSWWGGFVAEAGGRRLYFAGDSAAFSGFAEIGARFPGIDLALLPIGAYAPRWFMSHAHMDPAEAGKAFLDLGAARLVPMHWGAFQLTDEPISEPIGRLEAWWAAEGPRDGRQLLAPRVGEIVDL